MAKQANARAANVRPGGKVPPYQGQGDDPAGQRYPQPKQKAGAAVPGYRPPAGGQMTGTNGAPLPMSYTGVNWPTPPSQPLKYNQRTQRPGPQFAPMVGPMPRPTGADKFAPPTKQTRPVIAPQLAWSPAAMPGVGASGVAGTQTVGQPFTTNTITPTVASYYANVTAGNRRIDPTLRYRGDSTAADRYTYPKVPLPEGYASWRDFYAQGGRLSDPSVMDYAGARRMGGVIEPWFNNDLPQAPDTTQAAATTTTTGGGGWGDGGGGGWGGGGWGGGGGWDSNAPPWYYGLMTWRY